MFMCSHLVSGGMSVLLLFIVFLIRDWKELVGSFVVEWKSGASINSVILDSIVGIITVLLTVITLPTISLLHNGDGKP